MQHNQLQVSAWFLGRGNRKASEKLRKIFSASEKHRTLREKGETHVNQTNDMKKERNSDMAATERDSTDSEVVLRAEPRERGTSRVTLRCRGHAKPRIVAEDENKR